MTQVRMDIETIVVGGGPVASMVVLRPRNPRLTDGESSASYSNWSC